MNVAADEERIARLALELVVRRLAQRVTRNHPRAFDDLERDLDKLSETPSATEQALLMRRAAGLVGRPSQPGACSLPPGAQ